MQNYLNHISVLSDEVLTLFKNTSLDIKSEKKLYADLTLGHGGHTSRILQEIENSQVIAFDQDPEAVEFNKKNVLTLFPERLEIIQKNFVEFPNAVSNEKKFSGILLDLGVSSHHLDSADRGFSFREDGPLDMRMDIEYNSLTAEEIVNNYNQEDLANLIYLYGEDRLSRRIASAIIEKRKIKKIKTTKELEEIIFLAYPANARHKKPHPATRTFQALRIAVNRELEVLENVIPELISYLEIGGVLSIISFHSLEDRIVKKTFKELAENPSNKVKILTKKPVYPSEQEILKNIRSRSAKMRVIQKVDSIRAKNEKYKKNESI